MKKSFIAKDEPNPRMANPHLPLESMTNAVWKSHSTSAHESATEAASDFGLQLYSKQLLLGNHKVLLELCGYQGRFQPDDLGGPNPCKNFERWRWQPAELTC